MAQTQIKVHVQSYVVPRSYVTGYLPLNQLQEWLELRAMKQPYSILLNFSFMYSSDWVIDLPTEFIINIF